jgi:transposase InsO family protein
MTNNVIQLAVGIRLLYDGEVWQITQIEGSAVSLERSGSQKRLVLARVLMNSPGLKFLGDDRGNEAAMMPIFETLNRHEYEQLLDMEGHIRELLTGFRSGEPTQALPGEPRAQYLSTERLMSRYEAKAAELGIGQRTLRRLAGHYRTEGLVALVDGRAHQRVERFGRVDPRWVEMAREILLEHVEESQPPRQLVIDRINARVKASYGEDFPAPSHRTARRVLAEVARGQKAFAGESSKAKRSIADRPTGTYGRLRAGRPGDYIVLDTTPLDVFAMDPITLKWVGLELTVAMSVSTRCICGLRISPLSSKAVDAAMVLYETISHGSRCHTSTGILPYPGIPQTVYVPGADDAGGLPGSAVDTVVIDHGKMYMAAHIRTLCEQLGISIQPAQVLKSTDKPMLERFFRTLRDDLLAALPGYKGPDVYSRGKNVEQKAYYFIDEMEAVIRDWIVNRYHERPHDGLALPGVPGLSISPREMWELLTEQYGDLRVPARPDLVYDFLPLKWRTIQHYGVELNGLRYNGDGLNDYRNASSPYARQKGKWPIRFDPGDATRVFFQRPDDNSWHVLAWEHRETFPVPFSVEALEYARKLAARSDPYPDDRRALAELLDRWDAGLVENPTERRVLLRMSERRHSQIGDEPAAPEGEQYVVGPANRISDEPLGPSVPYASDDDDEDFYGSAFEVV